MPENFQGGGAIASLMRPGHFARHTYIIRGAENFLKSYEGLKDVTEYG
jgi:hypothetical protein